jgi:hypothetical protein
MVELPTTTQFTCRGRVVKVARPTYNRPAMSLHSIDLTAALRRIADKRIEEAMREGKFDNLEGAGKPLDLEPIPAEENARLQWWALRILRQNNVVPDEVRLRKMVDTLKTRLESLTDESALAKLVEQINTLVYRVNTLGTNALRCDLPPLDLETERTKLRMRAGQSQPT